MMKMIRPPFYVFYPDNVVGLKIEEKLKYQYDCLILDTKNLELGEPVVGWWILLDAHKVSHEPVIEGGGTAFKCDKILETDERPTENKIVKELI